MGGSIALAVTGVIWCTATGVAPGAERPSVREIAGDLQELYAPARRLELRLDLSLTANWPRRGNRAGVSVELATRPDFWYAAGVSAGTEVSEIQLISSDGVVTRTVITSDQTLAWSARVFKRIGSLVLSGGVLDSRATIGIELRGYRDRLRLEILASAARPLEYRSSTVRAGASLQWRWLYVQAGVQALAERDRRTAYLGVGMRWSDPDLRQLALLAVR